MRTLHMTRRVDNDRMLRLEIPIEEADNEIEVVVIIEPHSIPMNSAWREALKHTWGSCPDLEEPADPLPELLEERL